MMSLNPTSPCPSDYRSDAAKRVFSTSVKISNFFNGFSSTSAMNDTPETSQTLATAGSSQTAATPVSQTATTPPSQTVATPDSSPHVPCTHTSPAVIKMLKSLPLVSVLQMNKEIEDKNAVWSRKTFNHLSDPTIHMEPGAC